jgi:hypothetical protein
MTTETQAELNVAAGRIPAGGLTVEQTTALNGRCDEIQRLLDSTLENEARAYYLLEQEKWKGDWTKDPNWEIVDKRAKEEGVEALARRRSFRAWMQIARGFEDKGEPIGSGNYNRMLVVYQVIKAIRLANAKRIAEDHPEGPLPEPKNIYQCEAYAGLLKRADQLPDMSGWAEAFRNQATCENQAAGLGQSGDTKLQPPHLPPSDQDEVIFAWEQSWQSMPLDRRFDELGRPVAPIKRQSEVTIAELYEDKVKPNGAVQMVRQPAVRKISQEEAVQVKEVSKADQAKFNRILSDISETRQDRAVRSEAERIKAELRVAEARKVEAVKQDAIMYTRRISAVNNAVHDLLTWVRGIDRSKGTKYLTTMRMCEAAGALSCANDLERFQSIGSELKELLELIHSNGEPTGISFVNQDGTDAEGLNVVDDSLFGSAG